MVKKDVIDASIPIAVGVAQLAEHRVVASGVVGSIPITHPIFFAPVAQLDRAPDFESVGRGFETLRARHRNQWVTDLGL